MSQKPFFTIITVTYNAGSKVSKTIESVYKQSCTDYEYILVDGASKDDTVQIISEYKNRFDEKCISYKYVSEKDDGIYDAMNKSISMACGRWVCFLNAGDMFYDTESLEIIKKTAEKDTAEIVYGDTIEFKENGLYIYRKAFPLDQISQVIPFFHQSSVTKLEVLKKYLYDTKYTICADYDFFLRCYLGKAKFEHIDATLSRYEYGGISSCEKNAVRLLKEQLDIRIDHGIYSEEEICKKKIEFERKRKYITIKAKIERCLPQRVWDKLMYNHDIKRGWGVWQDSLQDKNSVFNYKENN